MMICLDIKFICIIVLYKYTECEHPKIALRHQQSRSPLVKKPVMQVVNFYSFFVGGFYRILTF